jgi:hypothetical protein
MKDVRPQPIIPFNLFHSFAGEDSSYYYKGKSEYCNASSRVSRSVVGLGTGGCCLASSSGGFTRSINYGAAYGWGT